MAKRWTEEQLAARQGKAFLAPKRKNKYGATRVYLDRMLFDSKGEAERYKELRLMEHSGIISDLVVHPKFPLHAPNGEVISTFTADFRFIDRGEEVIEDFKNVATAMLPAFRKNCRHVKAEYGIDVQVVMKS